MNWHNFDNNTTIGTKGSENGIILEDYENPNGARIALEKDGDIAPFAVTMGVYGIMFHTSFAGTLAEARERIEIAKKKIDEVLQLLDTPEGNRNDVWIDSFNLLMDEIAAI
jgi:hypothetical protein